MCSRLPRISLIEELPMSPIACVLTRLNEFDSVRLNTIQFSRLQELLEE